MKVVCPYCSKEGGKLPMKRWHFENCKWNHKQQDCSFPMIASERRYSANDVIDNRKLAIDTPGVVRIVLDLAGQRSTTPKAKDK